MQEDIESLSKELKTLQNERLLNKKSLEVISNKTANDLMFGNLGKDIENTINPKMKESLLDKIKKFFRRLC